MGRFLVIEGLDGAGTTTQAARLVANLARAGGDPVATREPTSRPIGRLIRTILGSAPGAAHPEALPWLFAADRADHLASVIEPALAAGRDVVSDRYYPSSLAYQSLDRPLDFVHALNARFRVPDLLVFLDVPVEVALARIEARGTVREMFEDRERLTAIAQRYEAVLSLLEARGEPIARVDGTLSVDDVERAIRAAVG